MRVYENGKYRDMTEDEIIEYNKLIEDSVGLDVECMKQDLAEGDYKVIKCMEYFLLGKDLPYDITALHSERQGKRDKINERLFKK